MKQWRYKMWLTRDKYGLLWLYEFKPTKIEDLGEFSLNRGDCMHLLDGDIYNWVTFENSPIEVELKLKSDVGCEK